jgi:acyl dehydratase
MRVEAGQTFSKQRTFTDEDVEAWTRLSGDAGRHHVARDGQGRLMVHGLLTASVPTGIGGELDYIARDMTWEFVRPVWSGDTVTAEVRIDTAVEQGGVLEVTMTVSCRNQHGKEVLKGRSSGVIR